MSDGRHLSLIHISTYYQFKRALQEEVAKSRLEEKGEPIPYERIKEYENLTDREMIEALTQNIQGRCV